DERAVALARVAVAAGARRHDGHRLPGAEEHLRPRRRRDAGAVDDVAPAALAPAEESPGRRAAAGSVDEGVAFVALRAERAPAPKAAAPLAGPARVLDQRVALDDERVLGLQRLDGQVRRVRDVHVHSVEPVLGRAGAGAAADRLEVDVEPAGARIDAAERR